jgi:hypothetical protein
VKKKMKIKVGDLILHSFRTNYKAAITQQDRHEINGTGIERIGRENNEKQGRA